MKVTYTVALLLLLVSSALATPPQAPMPPQAPPIQAVKLECECPTGSVCSCDVCVCGHAAAKSDSGWIDIGGGYKRHLSGYYYHPSLGVYWPESVRTIPTFQPMMRPIFGGFANCGPGG